MLTLENLGVSVGENGRQKDILKNINLELLPGRVYALTGPNGSGKTTLAKAVMGLVRPTSGRILWEGRDITDLDITARAREGIAYAFQQPVRFKGLKIKDLFALAGADGRAAAYLAQVGLCAADYLEREAGSGLSGGEAKRLEVALTLARRPRLAIFDEPEAGVDLWVQERLLDLVAAPARRGQGVISLVITHSEKFLQQADEVLLLEEGRLVEAGPPDRVWPQLEKDLACRWGNECGGERGAAECYR
ncbi:MAG: Fe-S cluster assembly ATP-binding protein [Bacillota bacterium]|nr:Fe-S cluster assembly ATP-binding protein [Bacillota bacterium]